MRNRLIYIASGFENRQWLRKVVNKLAGLGITQTYRWMDHEPTDEKDDHEFMRCGLCDLQGVQMAADGVAVVLPGKEGTHIELGGNLILGRPALLLSPQKVPLRRNPFYLNPAITRETYDPDSYARVDSVARAICEWQGIPFEK